MNSTSPVYPRDVADMKSDSFDPDANEETRSVITRTWQIIWRRKMVVAIVVAAALLGAIALTFLATPIYSAKATIEISRQEENIVKVDGLRPEATAIDQEFYQTQYALLESEALMDRVADKLRLASDPAFIAAYNIDPDRAAKWLLDNAAAAKGMRALELRRQIREALAEHKQISPIRGSRIVDIYFSSPDPNLSAKIANAWVEAFIASNFDRKLQSTAFATNYLTDQLRALRSRLEKSERDLVDYANQNRIITLNAGAGADDPQSNQSTTIADANLSALNQSYARVRAERIAAESRLRSGSSRESLSNQTLTTLRSERAKLAADYARLLSTFEPEYPEARAQKSQLDQLDASIRTEERRIWDDLQRTYSSAASEETRLANAVKQLEQENLDERRRGIQYNIFQREVDTNRELYDGLLQRFKEIGLAAGIGPNNILIVDRALPPEEPSSPNLFNNLLIGLLLGLLGSGAVIFVLEQFDQKIRSPQDVERATRYPVLGAIPFSDDESMAHWSDPKSALFEAYMSVQTALRLTTESGVPKSLMLTSTGPGEGKSMSCLSLARALRASGKTVLVVDADLRRPSVHTKLGMVNAEGLSEYLAGQSEWKSLLRETPVEGIDILTAGTVPPNPTELLAGHRLSDLIGEAGRVYDHVFIDSPPLLGLADAPLIAEKTSASVYVIEANNVSIHDVRDALTRLKRNAQHIVGVILTKYEPEGGLLGYSGYYAYEYSYASRDKEA